MPSINITITESELDTMVAEELRPVVAKVILKALHAQAEAERPPETRSSAAIRRFVSSAIEGRVMSTLQQEANVVAVNNGKIRRFSAEALDGLGVELNLARQNGETDGDYKARLQAVNVVGGQSLHGLIMGEMKSMLDAIINAADNHVKDIAVQVMADVADDTPKTRATMFDPAPVERSR